MQITRSEKPYTPRAALSVDKAALGETVRLVQPFVRLPSLAGSFLLFFLHRLAGVAFVVENQALPLLQGIAPRDEIEGLLAAQMIGVHIVAMTMLGRAMISGQTFEGTQDSINQATKMLRTFVAQMEALKKYRSGGQQKVTVEHVNIGPESQVAIGAVPRGGWRNDY